MVTAKTQYSLANAKRYFAEHLAVGDYYQEGQKVSGDWFGLGGERLGIAGRVHADDFLALCDNLNPSTGERLTVRMKTVRDDDGRLAANRRIFYDFTFSPPKSVSIVALVANDQRVVESHHRALQEALREFERFAAGRIRTNYRRDSRVTGNVVAAMFTHDSSRSLDPHLHTHCIVFNATFDETEDRWKALENYEMLRARKFVENLYYHELAKDLRRLGYSIQNTPRGDFEIEGVGKELCERFSKRHQQIDDAATALVANKPELAGANVKDLRERLATAERSRKMRDVSSEELRAVWTSQMSAAERASLNELANRPATEPEPPATQADILEAITWAEEHLFDRNSVVFEHDLWEAALRRARGKAVSIKALKAATGERGYLRDKRIPWQVTTEETLRREWEIVSLARDGIGQQGIIAKEVPALGVPLDSEQTVALHRLVSSRDFVTLFRGGAGTGKSYVLRELARVLEVNGCPVQVVAPQRQQVVDLEAAGLPAPTTVASFLLQESIAPRSVIMVDEAGQIGARQMLELFRKAAEIGGRLVLSGDTRQHGPVEASDALVAIERYAGLKPAELHSIRRQDPKFGRGRREKAAIGQYRRAVREAAQGKMRQSFDRLDRLGAVVGCRLNEQQDCLAREYLQLAEEGFSTVVVSQTWSEVHRVNEKVRAALKEKGKLGPDDTVVSVLDKFDLTTAQKRDPQFYDADSVVVFNRKVRDAETGTRGRFVAVVKQGVVVDVGQSLVTVLPKYLDRITICRTLEIALTRGDRIHLKANRTLSSGNRVANGELVTVRSVRPDGTIELEDGRTLDANYREFLPGYAVTSYGSQGKTVDYVLFSDSAVKAATNNQQWYVTISRGRRGIRIFTQDKEQLRENVIRSGQRKLALELAESGAIRVAWPIEHTHGVDRWLLRFGKRVVSLIRSARQYRRFSRNRDRVYELKNTRMLVH